MTTHPVRISTPPKPLSVQEQAEYAQCKSDIENGTVKLISAIEKVRKDRLYREEYTTFEDFCLTELYRTRQHINRLIVAQEVNENLEPIGVNVIESQARVLAKLKDPLEQQIAIQLAISTAAKVNPKGQITAAILETSVEKVQEMKATGKADVDGETITAAEASVIVAHSERVQTAIEKAKEKRGIQKNLIILLLSFAGCRIVGGQGRRVTFEFDSEEDAKKLINLWWQKAGDALVMKLTRAVPNNAKDK